jgi:hypothetical protein
MAVTGWQGNDGGQGGWNQPYGPDPHTNQYGTDPYANQYGSDPYSGGHGQNEQYQQPDPYAQNPYTQPYPQYQTGGFPAQGYGPPPPPEPKRSKLPMILSLIAIVIIVGAVVAIVIVNREDSQTTADPQPETTTNSGPSTEESTEKTTEKPSTSEQQPPGDDWIPVDNTKDAGLSYQVPPDWKTSSTPRASGLEVDFTGNADYGLYECEGNDYVRTFAASGDVQSPDGEDLDLAKTVTDFAKSFATLYYGADAEVDVPTPEKVTVDGKQALKLTAKVKPKITKPACQATEGEVALVGILLEADGKPADVTMLVVVNDLAGGPDDPKPVPASVSQEILATVKVN